MSNKSAKFGLFSIVLLGINSIIGSGIFGLPGTAYKFLGPVSVFALLFCMVLSVSIALCFAEAASYFDKDGGPFLYVKDAFGDFAGWLVGSMKVLISMIAWAAMAVFFATTLGSAFPSLANTFAKNLISGSLIIFLSVLNLLGLKTSKMVNNIITFGKLIPLIVFIIVGIFFIDPTNFSPFVVVSQGNSVSSAFASASIVLFYAFTGFESVAVAAKDMNDPKRNVPKALILVMAIVSLFYLLILIVSIGILGMNLNGASMPVALAFQQVLGDFGLWFITIGTAISVGGINMAASFLTPRSVVALSDQKMLPTIVSKENSKHAPYISIIIAMVLTLAMALSGTFSQLAQISVVSRFIQYIPTCLAVLVFRKKYPDQSGYRMPLGKIIPIFAILVSVVLLIAAGIEAPYKILFGLGGLIIVAPFYPLIKKIN